MKPYPHHYSVEASAAASGSVDLTADGLPALASAPPVEFDGPGDQWSPESLLVASVVACFVLTFRAIARASKLDWAQLHCAAEGTLDRVERVTRFVGVRIVADLALLPGGDAETGKRLLKKAEKTCLVTNSLNFAVELEANVDVES
jgi:organic hydroperoxide reductase OsmC/OhrA